MTLGGRKRAAHLEMARRDVEVILDHMHASKSEREMARGVFKALVNGPSPPALRTIMRRSVGSVIRLRKSAEALPVKVDGA